MVESAKTHAKLLAKTLEENRSLRKENEDLRRRALDHRLDRRPRQVEFIIGDLASVKSDEDQSAGTQAVLITLLSWNLVTDPHSSDMTLLSITAAQAFQFGEALLQCAKLHGFEA